MSQTDISGVADEKYIYLTTRGRKTGNSHTVELWFAMAGKKIYLSHEGAYTDWMKNILKDSRVEFRIGKIPFKGNARITESGEIFELGKNALYLKYYGEADKDTIDDWFSESTIIEISMIGTMLNASHDR
ncbi:MAG TPA: nitroreductase/quinone reductase family protein [Candidatus Bathyarchaeia archaeon]|nr:nitroreductase/quinone reductase family protein [Candidatus Bathyarchaeia archaeon]